MKYCEEYAALLDAYADGECTPEEQERVRAHLDTCAGCRAYLQTVQLMKDAFPAAEDADVPEGLADGVMAAVRAHAAPQRRTTRQQLKRWLPLCACLALAVGVSGYWLASGSMKSAASPAVAARLERSDSSAADEGSEEESALTAPAANDGDTQGSLDSSALSGSAQSAPTPAYGDFSDETTAPEAQTGSGLLGAEAPDEGMSGLGVSPTVGTDGGEWHSSVSPIFRNVPLSVQQASDGSSYEARLAALEKPADSDAGAYFQVESHTEDGQNIAYYGQWFGTPHVDQYCLSLYLADGTLCSLPLPWSGGLGIAPPDKMWFAGDSFNYEITFSAYSYVSDQQYHVAGTYRYTVDLTAQTVSLDIF